MTEWQPIETAKVNDDLWLTDGKVVTSGTYLGPYRTGHCIAGRIGWFGLTHWAPKEIPAPPLPQPPDTAR